MAAVALCWRFSSALRLTGAVWGGPAASSIRPSLLCNTGLPKVPLQENCSVYQRPSSIAPAHLHLCTRKKLTFNVLHKNTEKVPTCTLIHTSLPRNGLEEFFDDPKNWGKIEVKSGDSWTVEQLRGKSSEDLHKLWYVLLKERNMLLTLEQEAKRQRLPMPSPERLEKVKDSMERMDLVIQEREDALRLLQTGQEKERPGEWRHNFLGRTFWYEFKEWPIPWPLNARHNRKRFFFLPRVNHFNRLLLEKYLRKEVRKKRLQRQKEKMLKEKFPHLATQSRS